MADLGQAYVQIVPKATGISNKIGDLLSKGGSKAGESAGVSIASGLKKAIVAAGIGTAVKLQQSYLGGLDTLYGKAADGVRKYAKEASAAGISMNDYAEQAVSFGAALKSAYSGDVTKAAEAANTAILDMADNAAKMGTPLESIQNAYQGFAKQNYTMLDNLKLGYGGTKQEMERLLKDAEKLTGVKYDINNLGDVYSAIHAVQEELGLAGVAAEEAKTTLTGSFEAMKASGKNLLGSLALGEDIKEPLAKLTETAKTFFVGNLLPMVKNVVSQLPTVLAGLSNAIAPLVPTLIDAGVEIVKALVSGVAKSLPLLVDGLIRAGQAAFEALKQIDWKSIGTKILDEIKEGFSKNPAAMTALMTPIGLKMGLSLVGGFKNALGGANGIGAALKGILGGAGGEGAGAVGGGLLSDPKGTAKGLASVAIILGGMTALVTALGALQRIPHFKEFVADGGNTLQQVFAAIKKIATPETVATFAAIEVLGAIGVGTAASGIAAAATIIGGLTAIIAAFGGLNKIPGIQDFVSGGGDLLANVMEQVGRATAALAKGFAVELTSALPEIGSHLSSFANNAKPFFEMCSSTNFSGMDGFASGLLALVGTDLANKLEEFFFGSGLNFGEIGEQLSKFSEAMIPFFADAAAVGDMSAGIRLMESVSHIGDLVSATKNWEAGFGEADLPGLGKALSKYADAVTPFFTAAEGITNYDAGIKLMSVSGQIKNLLEAAEIKSDIGTKKMESLGEGLTAYAKEMDTFFKTATDIGDLSAGIELASISGKLSSMTAAARDYKSGSLETFGLDLIKFSANLRGFFENMQEVSGNTVDVSPILSQVDKLASGISKKSSAVTKAITFMKSGVSSGLNSIKSTFSSSASNIAKAADFSGKVKDAMSKVNSALTSANSTIKQNLNAIAQSFANTKFSFQQHIAVPHFSMSGKFDAQSGQVPKVNQPVWYAQGGIAKTASLIGIGEAGPEAIVPLDPFWKRLEELSDERRGGDVYNISLDYNASDDADTMIRDLARGIKRYRMAGVI